MHRTALGEVIARCLAPVVGDTLARGAVRAQLERLGITGDTLDDDQIEKVLVALEKGLRVFVGSPKASTLVRDVRNALAQEKR